MTATITEEAARTEMEESVSGGTHWRLNCSNCVFLGVMVVVVMVMAMAHHWV